jgi:hypothetical protein
MFNFLFCLCLQKMDHDVEKTTIEDNPAGEFDNRLLKRAKNISLPPNLPIARYKVAYR